MNLRQHLHHHVYPAFLLRHPPLIELVYAWNRVFLLRNRLVLQALCAELRLLPPGSLIVDAGCGDGLHVFSTSQKFRQLRFWGVDKIVDNIAFCKKRAARLPSAQGRFEFFHQHLEELSLPENSNLVLCVGTLQYISEDRQVLANFHKVLNTRGKLLLYVPVNGRTILPLYRYFLKKTDHYEKSQQRKRVYTPQEIFEKTEAAGFTLLERRFNYGLIGIAGHELYSLLLMGASRLGAWAWLLLPLFLLLLPLVLLLKTVDYILPKKRGNGLLIIAEKRN